MREMLEQVSLIKLVLGLGRDVRLQAYSSFKGAYFCISEMGISRLCVPPMLKQDQLDFLLFRETLCPSKELDLLLERSFASSY